MANENDIGGKVGLDITDFKTNIAELNRQIKVIDSGFKAAAAGMDDWGKSEEGLQTRIKSLNEITDLQRQKIANLTEQYQKIAAEKGENSKAAQDLQVRINKETESLNKNVSELNKSTSALDNFGKETDTAAGKTKQLDDELADIKSSLSDIGGNIANGAAIGIAAIGTAAIGAAAGAFKLATDAGKLADDLITMSNKTGISTKQLQEMEYASRFVDVELETMTGSMMKLTKAMDNARNGSKDVEAAFDKLDIKVTDQNGNLRDSQEVWLEAIKALGEMPNETERNAVAMQLFGKSAAELNPLIAAGADELARLGEEANNVGAVLSDEALASAGAFDDAMQKLEASMKGLTANIGASFAPAFSKISESINNALPGIAEKIKQIDFAPLADTLANTLTTAIQTVADILPKVVDGLTWIMDNSGSIAAGAVAIGAGMAAWNVVSMVQGVVKAVQAWQLANQGLAISQAALNLVMSLNPIGLIITVVAALVAGIITLWNTNEGFRNAMISAWEAIQSTFVAVWDWVKNNWDMLLLMLMNPIAGALKLLYDMNPKFKAWVDKLWNSIVDTIKTLPETISGFFSRIIEGIKKWGVDAVSWVKTEVPKIIQGIIDFFNELPGKIGYALGLAIGTLVKWGIDAVNWVKTEVPKIIQNIITFFTELPGKIATTLTNAINEIKRWGTNVVSWIATEVPKFISNIVNFFAELPGKVAAKLSEVLQKIKGWVSDAVTTVKTEVPKIVSNIVDFFAELPGKMVDIGKNIVLGIWDGINNTVGWLKQKITGFANGIVSGIKDALDIHSPSRVMRDEVGKMVGAGMAEGIADSAKQVNAAMKQIDGEVTGRASISPTVRNGSPSSGSVVNTFNFDGMMSGANFIVRDDADIPAIAKEVAGMIKNGVDTKSRGMGLVSLGG